MTHDQKIDENVLGQSAAIFLVIFWTDAKPHNGCSKFKLVFRLVTKLALCPGFGLVLSIEESYSPGSRDAKKPRSRA